MADDAQKKTVPGYGTFGPLMTFLNVFRSQGVVPLQVDKSHMRTASGSTQQSHLQTLKFLKLLDSASKPTPLFKTFVMADDEARKPILKDMLLDSYSFLFESEGFDPERASGKMVEDKFREHNLNGATINKAMAFFIAACKFAEIKLSDSIKAPPAPSRSNGSKKAKKEPEAATPGAGLPDHQKTKHEDPEPGVMKFVIPIPIDRKVMISIPNDFSTADWQLLQTMFTAYVTRWQAMDNKDKSPTPEGG